MSYILRTDKLSKPHYFAGALDAEISPTPVITSVIFNAWGMKTEDEANDVRKLLGEDDWTISQVSDVGFSQNLAPDKLDEFLKGSDEEVALAMEIYEHLVDVCEENDMDPTEQMRVLEAVNFTFITELFSRDSWRTALDRMSAELGRLIDEYPH